MNQPHHCAGAVTRSILLAICIFCTAAFLSHVKADEDRSSLVVSIKQVSSKREYCLGRATSGERPYIDRKYVFQSLPEMLTGHISVQTSMDDDYVEATEHLLFSLSAPATVYVGLDRRGQTIPAWLNDWQRAKESLSVDDVPYHIYWRDFPAGNVILGGNDRHKTGANSNYVVIIVPTQSTSLFAKGDFASQVQPLLKNRCHSCHGPDAQEGGLRLDIRRRAFLGGDTGAVIQPRSSESSELITRITSDDAKLRMPQNEPPLTPEEITLLKRWIDAGADWPDELAGSEEASEHWAFRSVRRPRVPLPKHTDWIRTPVDAFIASRLEGAELEPSSEANRHTLIRRLSLDLLGLPPTTEEIGTFLDDRRSDAYDRLVDRILESKHFGERWGKHWLDLARFAESDGYENDVPRPHAWRYRDWVINAINDDMPFDQFTVRQLAGDLLPNADVNDRIAAAFHRNTLHNSAGGADAEEFRSKAVKDRVAVTGTVWMGLTFNCCECHTHKYDPISHREYYQLYALFNNADHAVEGSIETIKPADRLTRIHKRGNFLDLGEEVMPGVPAFLPNLQSRGSKSDRLDMARWLVSATHPLTSRVTVNHVWQHLFGQGLVATPENFGNKGDPPSHPELLDWLAAELAGLPRQGEESFVTPWSRKSLIRLIVRSSVYRQTTVSPEAPPLIDPDNRLLWRQNRFRIEAEIVRDVALAASGLLESTVGGPSIQPQLPRGLGQLNELKNERFQESSGNPHRRGMYVHMQRTFPYPMFATFDGPDGNSCTVLRDRSTTPLQALALLNDPALEECARALGRRMILATHDEQGRVSRGFEWCLSRPPEDVERAVFEGLISKQRRSGATEESVWFGVARTLLNLDESITRE